MPPKATASHTGSSTSSKTTTAPAAGEDKSKKSNGSELQLPVGFAPPTQEHTGSMSKSAKKRQNAKKRVEHMPNEVQHEAGKADEYYVRKFVEMGFQEQAARHTLVVFKNDFDQTLQQLEAAGIAVLNQPEVAMRADKKNDTTRNDENVARLVEMGFHASDARQAIASTGNFNGALELLVQKTRPHGPPRTMSIAAPGPAASTASGPSSTASMTKQPAPGQVKLAPAPTKGGSVPKAVQTMTLGQSSATWAGPKAQPAPSAPAAKLTSMTAASPIAKSASNDPAWKLGDKCEGLFTEDGQWYDAMITHISPDGKTFTVTYIEYGNEENLPANSLRRPTHATTTPAPVKAPAAASPAAPFKQGDIVEGCFTEDNVWYKALIDRISADGKTFSVSYIEYGNSEDLPLSRLRPIGGSTPSASSSTNPGAAIMAPVAAPTIPAVVTPQFKLGDTVEAQFTEDNEWYAAVVTDISSDKTTFTVTYTAYGNGESLPASRLRLPAAPTQATTVGTPSPTPVHPQKLAPAVADAAPAPTVAAPAASLPVLQPGTIVEALFSDDGQWYTATINKVAPDGNTVTVTYVEYGNSESLPLSSIRRPAFVAAAASVVPQATPTAPIIPPSPAFAVNQLVQAQFSEDNIWYNARINMVQDNGQKYTVTYTEYGNSEIVHFSRVRPVAEVDAKATATVAPAPMAASTAAKPPSAAVPASATSSSSQLSSSPYVVAVPSSKAPAPAGMAAAPSSSAVAPGATTTTTTEPNTTHFEAKYADGQWYATEFRSFNPITGLITVLFTDYGNVEEVHAADFRPVGAPPAQPNKPSTNAAQTPAQPAVSFSANMHKPTPMPSQVTPSPLHPTQHHAQPPQPTPQQPPQAQSQQQTRPQWAINQAVEARYNEDNQWYPAIIRSIQTQTQTATVLYTEYGNIEEVTFDRLRSSPMTGGVPNSTFVAATAPGLGPGLGFGSFAPGMMVPNQMAPGPMNVPLPPTTVNARRTAPPPGQATLGSFGHAPLGNPAPAMMSPMGIPPATGTAPWGAPVPGKMDYGAAHPSKQGGPVNTGYGASPRGWGGSSSGSR